jgi:hypothetical protein
MRKISAKSASSFSKRVCFFKTGKKVSKNKQKFTQIDTKFQFLREFLQVFGGFE